MRLAHSGYLLSMYFVPTPVIALFELPDNFNKKIDWYTNRVQITAVPLSRHCESRQRRCNLLKLALALKHCI
jgi:hypothetical protein